MSYPQFTGSVTDAMNRLRDHIATVPIKLVTFTEDELTRKAPGKWSKKEILGHLIDSAINNLKRFTEAPFAIGSYSVQAYNQDSLVIANQYKILPVTHLIALWRSLNEQIVFVVEALPDESLEHPVRFPQPDQADSSLSWLIGDYVAHLEHHLKTLL